MMPTRSTPARLPMTLPVAAVVAAGLIPAAPCAARPAVAPAALPTTPSIDRVAAVRVQDLDLPVLVAADGRHLDAPARLDVAVLLDDAVVELNLRPHSIRADGFRVLVQQDDGELYDVAPPPLATYRGTVTGYPDSFVAASLVDGRLTAHIELTPDSSPYDLQPASDFPEAGLPAGSHVSFRSADVTPGDHWCGVTDETPMEDPDEGPGAAEGGAAAGTGFKVCELACDADAYFFQQNGSNLAATVSDIENVLNMTEFVYERDTDITYEVTVIVVRTSFGADPYTSSDPDVLLCQFRNQWNASPLNLAPRDTAQLFTGRTLGANVGLAWNGVICNFAANSSCGGGVQNLAYSLVESRFGGATMDERVALSAHEIGHNWNAIHCSGADCHIMCANINGVGCGGVMGADLVFGPLSIATILSFKNSRTCLDDLADPQTVPFFDDLPVGSINQNKWSYSHLATTSSASSNPPSVPNAFLFRSLGATEYRDAELRSNFILLGGQSNLVLTYWTEHVGVEAGESLFVDYWGSNLTWNLLNTIVSDGVDQTAYVVHTHDLPPTAYHDEFRIRFRVEGNETNDAWYVDDVYVGPEQTGACCVGQLCALLTPGDCAFVNGSYQGNGVPCSQAPCAPPDPTGACCFGDGTCTVVTAAACGGSDGAYQGDGIACASANCPQPCPEDLDDTGDVGFSDILVLLAAWGPCPACPEDLDGTGDVGFSDILVLLAAWGPCQ